MTATNISLNKFDTKGEENATRSELAIKLLQYGVICIIITLIGCFILIYSQKIEIDKAITLILAVSSIFSGLLGSAITYYFSTNK